MNLTNLMAFLSLLGIVMGGFYTMWGRMERKSEKHSNEIKALTDAFAVQKTQTDKDVSAVDKKADSITTEFRAFVNKHFETEASNNEKIMRQLEQNNRDVMQKFDETNKKFDETNKKFENTNKEMSSIRENIAKIGAIERLST